MADPYELLARQIEQALDGATFRLDTDMQPQRVEVVARVLRKSSSLLRECLHGRATVPRQSLLQDRND